MDDNVVVKVEGELAKLCEALLDDINERHGDKDRAEWDCPFLQAISDYINYK